MTSRDGAHKPEPVWLYKHTHEPNPEAPTSDADFTVALPDSTPHSFTVDDLATLPQSQVDDCYIVSTGHGASGPFTFGGVRLRDFVTHYLYTYSTPNLSWNAIDVISADGFGNRVFASELANETASRTFLLATHRNQQPLTRAQGLVRLIVPSETDDALRQVKWISRLEFRF